MRDGPVTWLLMNKLVFSFVIVFDINKKYCLFLSNYTLVKGKDYVETGVNN